MTLPTGVTDTNYTGVISGGGAMAVIPVAPPATTPSSSPSAKQADKKSATSSASSAKKTTHAAHKSKSGGFVGMMDGIVNKLFQYGGSGGAKKKPSADEANDGAGASSVDTSSSVVDTHDATLHDKLEQLIQLPDDEYSDKALDAELRKYLLEAEASYTSVMSDLMTHVAPSYREAKANNFMLSGLYGRSFFVQRYPSYLDFLWIRDILGMYGKRDISRYVYPADEAAIKGMLKKKVTELKAEINTAQQKGITIDTEVEIQYRDVQEIRQKIATREERYFQTGMYVSLYTEDEDKLTEETKKFEQKIAGFGIRTKPTTHRMDDGVATMAPLAIDDIGITRSTVTTSLGGSFPFIANDLIDNTGILYGLNSHSGSLVIFDRFKKKLTNANSVVLATSGAGKSFTVKLEILRYLMLDVDIIVIDPENEYKSLCSKVGGQYVNIAVNSRHYVNPFDLPPKIEDREYQTGDLLRGQIMSLIGLFATLLGGLSPAEEAIMDKALQAAYSLKEITFDDDDVSGKTVPRMEDLLYTLESMQGGEELAIKLSKYVTGTFGSLFNNYTNIDMHNKLTVFSIRDLEESLKTPAMYNVLNFIWTRVRSKKRKRLLIVDEAWIMMQHDMSANFLFGLIKRARKYGLGVTTITQDVEDFVRSPYGKPIVSNSSMQILLKQSTVSIKSLEGVFSLSEAEKQRLVSANVGEGLIFAGNQHVGIQILASPYEKDFITTDVT